MNKALTNIKMLLLVFCGFLLTMNVMGQRSVTGKVTDAGTGEGLIGATIQVKGTSQGTIADLDGNYTIQVSSSGDVLTFSYIGYDMKEEVVGERSSIDISLTTEATKLDELVVIGYGSVKKSDLTGAVAVVTSDELNRTPSPTFQQALQGKAAGVLVSSTSGAPGTGVSIKIRGVGSISRSGNPIYVIDGIITGSLNSVNPADIESLQVLKDASAAAIYGADGANGVIIITTKRGEPGKTKLSYSSYYSINQIPKKLDLMNAGQYSSFYNTLNDSAGILEPAYTDEFREWYYGDDWENGTDWQDELSQTGFRHNQYIRLSGGGENNNYSISGNYYNEQGTVIGTGAKRYNFRANSDFRIGKWLKIGETFNFSRNIRQVGGGFGGGNITSPLMKVYNPDNKEGFEGPQVPYFYDYDGDGTDNVVNNTGGNDKPNPVVIPNVRDNYTYSNSILGNLYAEITFVEWLKFKTSGSLDMANNRSRSWTPSYESGVRSNGQAVLSENYSEFVGLQLENQLTFDKQLGSHHITAIAVQQVRKNDQVGIGGVGRGFPYEYLQVLTQAEEDGKTLTGYYSPYRMLSYLGRIIYDYKSKIFFTGSIRKDGVSVFGAENRWGTFPSASVAYKINEDLFPNAERINMLKLRVGWGLTGNSDIGNFNYDDFLSPPKDFSPVFGDPGTIHTGTYILASFANPLIKWESAEMFNFGFDLNAFNNKLQLSAEYYVKNQNDLLVKKDVSVAFGRASSGVAPWANIGINQNRGFEATLTYRNYDGAFQYSSFINFTSFKNEVISLPVKSIITNNNITIEGHTIGSLYGYQAEGIITPEDYDEEGNYLYAVPSEGVPSPGDLRFRDLNNDGKISDLDRTIIGKALPDYIIGFNFECSWNRFDFSVFLNGVFGAQVFNSQRSGLESFVNQDINHNKLTDYAQNYYTVDRPSTEYLRADLGNSNFNNRTSSWWVEDASYLRARDIQLGYNISPAVLNKAGIASTRVYVSCENLFIITKYKGRDPENGAFSSPTTSGTDGGGYPNPRILTFGIQVDF